MSEPSDPAEHRINLTPLLDRARQGDKAAFDKLMAHLGPAILRTLRGQGASEDDANDALGQAMWIVYRLIGQNRFDSIATGGFISYFRTVAVHEWRHRSEVRRALKPVSLSAIDRDTGESVSLDVPDDSLPLADRVANQSLYDFLMQQLDEVFVAGRTGAERDRGEMEKLAFIYFYQDGCTQVEILDILTAIGANFPRMTPITKADLNNWLSMGRSLKALLKHLAERHSEILGILVDLHLSRLNLSPEVAETLRLTFRDGHSPEQIAALRGMELAQVRQQLSTGKRDLVDGLARTIKAQLKTARAG